MKESADKPEKKRDLSFLEISKINEDESYSELRILNSLYKNSPSIESEKHFNELYYFGNKSRNSISTVKDEKQTNRNEVIKELEENKNKINEECIKTEKEDDFKNNIHLTIVRVIKHFMQKMKMVKSLMD